MNLIAFNESSIGASHVRIGKECQDYSLSCSSKDYCIAITCDGHGGDNYFRSALGSRYAAESAFACVEEFLKEYGSTAFCKPEDALIQLEKSVIARWNSSVWEHFESNPFSEEELLSVSKDRRKRLLSGKSIESTYGTTLIAMAWSREYWFAIQIGDGKVVRVGKDGTADCPVPANEKCFLNTTTSICDVNALENFRHFYSTELPAGVFCGSDGVDDSFITAEQLYKLYLTVGRSFADSDFDSAKAELKDYLPRLSSKGSGDDVSIAGILDLELADNAFPQIEENAGHAEDEPLEADEREGVVRFLPVSGTPSESDTTPEGTYEHTGIPDDSGADSIVPDEGEPQETPYKLEENEFDEETPADRRIVCEDDSSTASNVEGAACAQVEDAASSAVFDPALPEHPSEEPGEASLLSESVTDHVPSEDAESFGTKGALPTETNPAPEENYVHLLDACPECGTENVGSYRFCPNCGTPLSC